MIPGLGRSPGEGKGYPLPYFGPENSTDYTVHGVAKSRTRLSGFHSPEEERNIQTYLQVYPSTFQHSLYVPTRDAKLDSRML